MKGVAADCQTKFHSFAFKRENWKAVGSSGIAQEVAASVDQLDDRRCAEIRIKAFSIPHRNTKESKQSICKIICTN